MSAKKKITWIMLGVLVMVLVIGLFTMSSFGEGTTEEKQTQDEAKEPAKEKEPEFIVDEKGNLKIRKSAVSATEVKFFPVEVDKIKMEVMAVIASDGTIRTAFNTCQICYSSGRGYYTQQGNEVICRNCGNRFKIDQIELVKGGCNPVPIVKKDKTEDETHITISKQLMAKYKNLFLKWKK